MYTLKNTHIELSIDERGMLTSLKHVSSSHDYAGSKGLWRIIYSFGLELEREIRAEDCIPEITQKGSVLTLYYPDMRDESGTVNAALTIHAELADDDVLWRAELQNNEAGTIIREFHFPLIAACRIKEGQSLIWSKCGGERFWDIHKHIRSHHTAYKAKDNKEVRSSALYPGSAATNSFTIEDGTNGLYFGCHNPGFPYTLHLLGATEEDVNISMVQFPFISEGKTWNEDGYVLSPYQGTWHKAAEKYRFWADSWFRPATPPEHIQEMSGWQRIILRHQYGEIHYRYDQLEQIYREGTDAGIDTIFLFGWHRDGHDAGYPEYDFDESQGGFEALKENISKVQKAGGKIILYFNGQLIDMGTEFYQNIGRKVSIKKADSNEHMEVYPFGGNGTALRLFGNKTFVTACPASELWLDVLKGLVDKSVSLGVDGVFFDQLGFLSQPCFDESHGHEVPLMNLTHKSEMVRKLREYVKGINPEMSFGIEWLSDATAQHVDYVHSVIGGAGSPSRDDWKKTGGTPEYRSFMDWFYYAFPEVRTTDREIRDDTDVKRRVNLALLKGLMSDVEIYRCRKTIAETPIYREYLAEANRLRDTYRDLLLNGRYCDTRNFTLDTDLIDAASFEQGDRLAVVLTQSYTETIAFQLCVEGYRYVESDGMGEFQIKLHENGTQHVELTDKSLLVTIFERQRKPPKKIVQILDS